MFVDISNGGTFSFDQTKEEFSLAAKAYKACDGDFLEKNRAGMIAVAISRGLTPDQFLKATAPPAFKAWSKARKAAKAAKAKADADKAVAQAVAAQKAQAAAVTPSVRVTETTARSNPRQALDAIEAARSVTERNALMGAFADNCEAFGYTEAEAWNLAGFAADVLPLTVGQIRTAHLKPVEDTVVQDKYGVCIR